jgi:hypothetical protein
MKVHSRFAVLLPILTLALSGSLQSACAAYLESGSESRVDGPRPPDHEIVRPVPPPPPLFENPLRRLVRAVDIGGPESYRGLIVYPLILREGGEETDIRTLDEAFSRDWITIRELESAQVSELLVRNESRRHLFLMSGEILAGGRQDRIIRSDVLLDPRSDFVRIPVYCGEKERWNGARESFASSKYLADQGLRSLAAKSAAQGEVWSRIDEQLGRAEVAAPTRNYQEIYRDREVGGRIDDHVARFRHVPGRRTVGAVIVVNGRIVSCDLFGDADLFARLWDKICRSHALEVVLKDEVRERKMIWPDPPDAGAVRRFLDRTLSARISRGSTPGVGEALVVSGSVEGSALVWRDRVVHAALFPGPYGEPMPLLERPQRRYEE